MYWQLIPIVVPVFLCVGIGFGWARLDVPFDREFITRIVMNVGAPCLILDGIGRLAFESAVFVRMAGIASLLIVIVALAAAPLLWLLRQPLRSYLPPTIFGNVGNLGLPLCYFAFGREGLGLAIAFYLVYAVTQFLVGPLFQGRQAAWRTLVTTPIIYAALAGLLLLGTGTTMPVWLGNTVELLGGLAIPLMLIAMGHGLGSFEVRRLSASLGLSVLRLSIGFGAGLLLVEIFSLEGAARGIVLIEASMPVAVFNYLMAARYERHPEDVAGAIVVSTLISFGTLPLLLSFVL